jgi:hypothetical protein
VESRRRSPVRPAHLSIEVPSPLGAGLRSILTVLKQQKVIFTNPIASIRTGYHEPRQPLPVDLARVREALESPTRPAPQSSHWSPSTACATTPS